MFNQEQIKAVIPHRDPFLFVDEIIYLDPLKKAIGKLFVRESFDFFRGHFPQKPVMPGVLIVEALAQVGAFLLLIDEKYKGKIAYFTGIKNTKIRRQVQPNDTLTLQVILTKLRSNFGFGEAHAYIGDELVVESEFSFAVQ
jgi:3-hydroxyacyl-[acyl-carrier-protein] dehydratase